MRKATIFLAATILAVAPLSLAVAYSVQPMIYSLTPSGGRSATRLSITNSRDEMLNIEVVPFAVSADEDGKRNFVPAADDFAIFPPQASIAPDRTQSIQVRYVGAPTLAQGKVYVLRVVQTNTTEMIKQDPAAAQQSHLAMSLNFNTTAIVQPADMKADLSIAQDLTPDAKGVLHARLINRGSGVADLSRYAFAVRRGDKLEQLPLDKVRYGEAVFMQGGSARAISLSDDVKGAGQLIVQAPDQKKRDGAGG